MKKAFLALALVVALLATLELRPQPAHAQSSDFAIVPLVNSWNVGSVTSGSSVLASNVSTTRATSVIRIAVVLGSSVPLSIKETNGAQTFTSALNGGTALTANTCYTFVWEARNKDAGSSGSAVSFNFVVGGPSTVPILRVTEVAGGVD